MDTDSGRLSGVTWAEVQAELRRRMSALPYGQKSELAERLGVSPVYLSHIINTRRPLTVERAELVAAFLGVTLDIRLEESQI